MYTLHLILRILITICNIILAITLIASMNWEAKRDVPNRSTMNVLCGFLCMAVANTVALWVLC